MGYGPAESSLALARSKNNDVERAVAFLSSLEEGVEGASTEDAESLLLLLTQLALTYVELLKVVSN